MGSLTAKTSGDIASFMSPSMTNIKSLKVHFSPKQLGTGDPSPENVREIEGWDGVEVTHGINILDGLKLEYKEGNCIYPYGKGSVTTYGGIGAACKTFIDIEKYLGETIILNHRPTGNGGGWAFYNKDINDNGSNYAECYIDGISNNGISTQGEWEITIPNDKNIKYMRFTANPNYINDVKIILKNKTITIPYQWKLPDEYQEVEYIEKTDYNQYIDTGILGDGELQFKCKLNITQIKNGSPFFGSYGNSQRCYFLIQNNNNIGYSYITSEYSSTTLETNKDYNINVVFKTGEQQLYVDNNIVLTTTKTGTIKTGKNIFLFGYNFDGHFDVDRSSFIKLYNAILYKDNVLVRNFIPCYRKSDNEIGMYDTVSQTFYTNQGTGTFLKGEDVDKTFYGGYIDLISGELVGTHNIITFDGSDDELITHSSNFNDWVQLSGMPNMKKGSFFSDNSSVSNRAKKVSSSSNKNELQILIGANNTKTYIYNIARLDSTVTTDETLRNWFSNNPITFTYPLENPITHQLTPTQLQSFVGQNNFWSNADYVEIEYDLIETIDIQKARQKIILNQPHVESKKGSESSTEITHFKTDMVAPLKECKVYFDPLQDGSGDPSPTNIRPITGWTGVTLNHTGVNMLECDSPDYFINNAGTNDGVASTLARNTDGQIESIAFNGTSKSINIFRNLNYTPASPSEVTMPSGQIALSSYSSQIYLIPMGNSNIPRTISGKAWHQSYVDSENGWTEWNVNSSSGYNGLWIRAQMFPQQSGLNIDTIIYPMMCLAEDKGCEFEVYKGNKYSVDWTDNVGTVYGGYVDLVKGELVATYVIFEKKWNEYQNNYAMTDVNRRSILFPYERRKIGAAKALCNIAPPAHDLQNKIHFYIAPENNYIYMFLPKDLDEETLIQVASKIEEPIHYSLTSQQLLTLKGINNIWSDTNGQTEVKFWSH